MLGLEVAALGECELARLLQDKLRYEMRLQYMVRPCPLPCHVSPGSPCPELGVQLGQIPGGPMRQPPKQGACRGDSGHSCGDPGGTVGGSLTDMRTLMA